MNQQRAGSPNTKSICASSLACPPHVPPQTFFFSPIATSPPSLSSLGYLLPDLWPPACPAAASTSHQRLISAPCVQTLRGRSTFPTWIQPSPGYQWAVSHPPGPTSSGFVLSIKWAGASTALRPRGKGQVEHTHRKQEYRKVLIHY